jgi:hypothetical protein
MFKRGYWSGASVRKPLAVYCAAVCLVLCVLSWAFNRDIPPGAVTVLSAIVGAAVLGYCSSSAYEATHKEEEKPNE